MQLNTWHRWPGGIEAVVDSLVVLLREHGVEALLEARYSADLPAGLRGKLQAFCSGIYSLRAKRTIAKTLAERRPDVVHAHNVYPLLSPSVLVACREAGIPTLVHLHDYYLTCPTYQHLRDGQVCERCCGGREHWAVLLNCRKSWPESVAYALRCAWARRRRLFQENTSLFIALTEFARRRLLAAGFAPERIVVLPNMVALAREQADPGKGRYIAFSGRLSIEKGVGTLLEAARRTGLPVRIAGDGPLREELARQAPPNVEFCGRLDRAQIESFYRQARFIVVPSIWFEMCPLVISEAMSFRLPVITSRIGGLPELVDDEKTGLLFEPGNAGELAEKMRRLWDDPQACREMGAAGRAKAECQYAPEVYFQRLKGIYDQAIERGYATSSR